MMQDVARWLHQRQISFTTNEVEGEKTFLACFADQPGSQPSYACTIGTSPEKNVLILDAVFNPAIPAGTEVVAFVWLTTANSNSQWGFYGFDAQQSRLWFRISLFRPDQRVKTGEMDELLDKTSTAMRDASDLLMAESAGEATPTPENQIKPVRENLHPTLVLTSSKTGTPRSAVRFNSTKQMNYLQVSPDQR